MDPGPGSAVQKIGYRQLAEWMAWNPSNAIFRRFRVANMLNVLYLQSEVAELEKKYNAAVLVEDRHQNGYSCDWTALRKAGKKSPQWDAFQQLRERLIEYG